VRVLTSIFLTAWSATLCTASCTSTDLPTDSVLDASARDGQAGEWCEFSSDCPPPRAAYASCAAYACIGGRCLLQTLDADHDGHATSTPCTVQGDAPVTVAVGDDCDDNNPDLYPGHPARCSKTAAGAQVVYPGGVPRGACRYGAVSCLADGTASSCIGAIAPRAEDCSTRDVDEDCDGSNVTGCSCTGSGSVPCGDTRGACIAGTQTCLGNQYSACTGGVPPKPRDCASPNDNDCDGRPDDLLDALCKCTLGATRMCEQHPGLDGRGACRAGSQQCAPSPVDNSPAYAACVGSVGPRSDTCGIRSGDLDCNGVNGDGATPDGAPCAVTYSCDVQFDWRRGTGCSGGTKLLTTAAGNIPVNECTDGATPATIYLGLTCPNGTRRFAGYISPIDGGPGWVPLLSGYSLR
jgi:hypothetical protein